MIFAINKFCGLADKIKTDIDEKMKADRKLAEKKRVIQEKMRRARKKVGPFGFLVGEAIATL